MLATVHDQAVVEGDAAPELPRPDARVRPWRSPLAWGMALMFGMTSLITYSMFTWLPILLTGKGDGVDARVPVGAGARKSGDYEDFDAGGAEEDDDLPF